MEQEERDFVVFTDDDGNEFELDIIDYFDHDGEEYAVLMDLSDECECEDEEHEQGHEHEVYIMKIVTEGDTEEFVPADEDKLDELIAIVEGRMEAAGCDCDDEDCEGCDCGCEDE